MKQINRINELDIFRGIAALCVVLYHFTDNYQNQLGHPEEWISFSVGYFRMPLFFVLSGFVTILLLERTKSVMDFFASRITRLYPAYLIAITISFLVLTFLNNTPMYTPSVSAYLANFTFIHIMFGDVGLVDAAHWTMVCEIMFYGLMTCILLSKQVRHLEYVAFSWLLFVSMWWLIGTFPEYPHIFGKFVKYSPMLVVGMMFYRMRIHGETLLRYLLITWAFTLYYSFFGSEHLVAMSIICGLFYMSNKGYLNFLAIKPLLFLGTISYSWYLTHRVVGFVWIYNMYEWGFEFYAAVGSAVVLSFILGTLVTFYIELPGLKYGRIGYQYIVEQISKSPRPGIRAT